ncbi:polysaccharide deacetylase family protein [Anaerosinus sp.]|uniref:hypothetical protein n=1 Tax=Selenobaculum sp. TaxID=3074374 RepID=UPI003AB1EC2E
MKQILLTCDTEIGELGKNVDNAFDIFVRGRICGQTIGVELINTIANEYDVKVNHFIDVYYPGQEKNIILLCEDILSGGHAIGLHTHPSSRFGNRYMYNYSKEEQDKIIFWGKNFLYKEVGIDVNAHRAGGYGTDNSIFEVLKNNGIYIDSSFFYKNEICKIQYPYKNLSAKMHGIWEVPITVYEENRFLCGCELQNRKAVKKLDFRYGSNSKDILSVIDKSPQNTVIVLFLHSFNFIKLKYSIKNKKFNPFEVDNNLINEYRILLQGLRSRKDCIFSDLNSLNLENCRDDYCISMDKNVDIQKVIKEKFSERILRRIKV